MHNLIVVKIGGSKKHTLIKKPKLNENRGKFKNFDEIGGEFMNFEEIGENLHDTSLN